jgi:DNA-binding response OmpR family regulator
VSKVQLLVVEDDIEIQETLKLYLIKKGYDVKQAYTCQQALLQLDVDLIIIDIQLPDGNGISLCQKIRQTSSVPIIFLTALTNEKTIVEALNKGGDDYVKKPFHMSELLARIECISRRIIKPSMIKTNDLLIDMNNYKVYKQNKEIELTAIGYEILFLLVKYQGTVITRERMIEFIEERTGNYIENNTVSVHMKRIREKLGTYNNQSYIETVRGIGYRWKI